MFGGSSYQDDTWEWNGTFWREVETPLHPSGRYDSHIVFDENSGAVVLFAGKADGERVGDTWVYRGQ